MSKQKSVILLLAGILIGMAVMYVLGLTVLRGDDDTFSDPQVQKKIDVLLDNVGSTYYFDYDRQDIYEGMYKGMVEGLGDRYSEYMTPDEYKFFMESNAGSFYGIGVVILDDGQAYNVISVNEDSPAKKAGIKAGDKIIEVDGKEYDSLDMLVSNLRGESGTEVSVTVVRDNEKLEFKMTRAEIVEESVTTDVLDGNIGYIKISSFIRTTDDDFKEALADMEGKDIDSLIIDLRDNGGGLLQESLNIADMLLDKCDIVTYVDKKGNKRTETAEDGRTDLDYVVLVNENTASASEVLAAAIQDNKGGEIIGQKTFGKGIIQMTSELYDGSALKLTAMEYLSPDGHKIHEKGVKPDVKVKNKDDDTDAQLKKAMELLD